MSFDTPGYLLFLAAVVPLHRLCPQRWRWLLLLAASFFFYACFSLPLSLLILAVILLTWLCAMGIGNAARPVLRRLWLSAAVMG